MHLALVKNLTKYSRYWEEEKMEWLEATSPKEGFLLHGTL